jgi:hypothetical protein
LVITLAIVGSSLALLESEYDYRWFNFVRENRKAYANSAEALFRKRIYKTNVDYIEKHNAEADLGIHSYRLSENSYTDMTGDEFATLFTGDNVVEVKENQPENRAALKFQYDSSKKSPSSIGILNLQAIRLNHFL